MTTARPIEAGLVCPVCRTALRAPEPARLVCVACDREFPVLLGIPDLRIAPDPYIGIEADRAKGMELAQRYRGLDFEQTVDLYYSMTSVVPPLQATLFKRGLLAGPARARAALESWEAAAGVVDASGMQLLEVGCGTAPLLSVAAGRYRGVVGVDIAFRWLVVARKRLEEAGLDVPLVCACAEALPFDTERFDCVVLDSVLEHLADAGAALDECRRVTVPGAALYLTTPNRFSLGPDPHAGVWAGGWWPDRLIARYVARRGGIPPRRRLLSAPGVRRRLRQSGFAQVRLYPPRIPSDQRARFDGFKRVLIDGYGLARRLPMVRGLLLGLGPLIAGVARRNASRRDPPHAGP